MINNFFSKQLLLIVGAFLVLGTTQTFANTASTKLSQVNDLTKSKSADKAASKKITEPSVSTEKSSYSQGDNVTVNGTGFKKYEQITVSVERENKLHNQSELLANWTVYADQNGNVSFDWYIAFSANYKVKLTGDESKMEATTSFAARTVRVDNSPNVKCSDINPAYTEFKIEPPVDGTYTFTDAGGATITVDFYGGEGELTFVDFEASRFFGAVIVKGGTEGANVYEYDPAVSSDTGLSTPNLQNISHVSFCTLEASSRGATIKIIKDSQPNTTQAFNFTASGQIDLAFSLVDDGDGDSSNRYSSGALTGFGAANSIRVTELESGGNYQLIGISCTSNGTGAEDNNINVQARFVDIVLQPGENVVCTFVNAVTTAADGSVSGLVLDSNNQGMARTFVTITNLITMESQTVRTNPFGRYRFNNLEVGDVYSISVANKKVKFDQQTQSFVLNGNLDGINFTALAR